DDVEERRRNREAAFLDVVGDVAAVLVEQNRSAEQQLEIHRGMLVQLPDQQLTPAVVRAAGDRKTDAAFAALAHYRDGSCLTLTVFHSQYTSSDSVPGSRKPLPEFFTP